MVTRYLRETEQASPEIDARARGFVSAGYQRLLTFESSSQPGGFTWFGGPEPGNVVLTAAGLQILQDMDGIVSVDRAVLARAQDWLVAHQAPDGSWDFRSNVHSDIEHLTLDRLRATAYVAWALADTGYEGRALDRALDYVQAGLAAEQDLYTLGLVANALVSAAPDSLDLAALLGRLHEVRQEAGQEVWWTTEAGSVVGSHGPQADTETTGLVTLALVRAGVHRGDVQGAIGWLSARKDSHGQWGSTQATVLALRAMIASLGLQGEEGDAQIRVAVDGELVETLEVTAFNADVMQLVDLRELTGEGRHEITLTKEGEGSLFYQLVQVHHLPWALVDPGQPGPLSVEVEYDRTDLEVEGAVTGTVTVVNRDARLSEMVMVELGLPPGFSLDRAPLDDAVADGRLRRYETRPRLLVVYLTGVVPDEPRRFTYRLVAETPLRAEVPRARVYSYYNPEVQAFAPPVELVVQ